MRGQLDKRLPQGKYYIGDLCYVMADGHWDEFLELTALYDSKGKLLEYEEGFFEFKGYSVGWHGTEYGDGFYTANMRGNVNDGEGCPVDSGTIGIIPWAYIAMHHTQKEIDEKILGAGIIHEFDDSFYVELGVDSKFGKMVVKTTSDRDDDDEEYEQWRNDEYGDDEDDEDDEENESDS